MTFLTKANISTTNFTSNWAYSNRFFLIIYFITEMVKNWQLGFVAVSTAYTRQRKFKSPLLLWGGFSLQPSLLRYFGVFRLCCFFCQFITFVFAFQPVQLSTLTATLESVLKTYMYRLCSFIYAKSFTYLWIITHY